ncbi:serine/threonine-protein kinase [Myxococcus faecalis]|uniref:serine/threonine-protein kinase n=1 Tax=Myxococcus faecalis TaxID=3115646 RepID=UPI003CF917D6
MKRSFDSEPTPAAVRPLVEGVPAAYAARMAQWEKSATLDALVGRQVGDYLLKRRIGSGGMGIVYEGVHAIIGRKVAIKVLRPDFVEGGRARDLATEARAAAAIRHPGIIDIFGFGTIPDVGQYLVMEYLEGAPLDEVIQQRAPMRELDAMHVLEGLLSALAAAHSVGVIHRDLKPGNVFLVRGADGSESVKVLDFGIAKRSDAPYGSTPQTHANALVGTPEYIAPEQACGQQVSPQTDLYAVGVIAYEMLTRRLPFQGETSLAIVLHHVRTPPPRLSEFAQVHPALEALVSRLMAKAPASRPASAEMVRRELKQLRADMFGAATRPAIVVRDSGSSEQTLVEAPAPGARGARRAGRPKGVAVVRRRASPDSDAATNILVRPTRFPEATKLDHAPVRTSRSRKLLMGVGGAVMLAMGAGGWALLSSARASPAPRVEQPAPHAREAREPVEEAPSPGEREGRRDRRR